MKKIYALMVVAILGTTTIFAQGLGASLDYAMWNGAMIENSETTGSTVLAVNYTHNLSEKMDLVGSVGYGIGFGVVPVKADLNYGITTKLSANLGIGIYMISDETYEANSKGEDGEAYSLNEFGTNIGLNYQLTSALSFGFNYNMIKSGDFDFNGMQFGLSYAFGSSSEKGDKPAKKKKTSKTKTKTKK